MKAVKLQLHFSLGLWSEAEFLFFLSPMDSFENLGHCLYFWALIYYPASVTFIPHHFWFTVFQMEWYFSWHAELCNDVCQISLVIVGKGEKNKAVREVVLRNAGFILADLLRVMSQCKSSVTWEWEASFLLYSQPPNWICCFSSCAAEQHKYCN